MTQYDSERPVPSERAAPAGRPVATEPAASTEQPISTILSGIVTDVQELARKEVALAREEIREELTVAKDAAIKLGIAVGVLAVGGLFILIALAFGINALFDWPNWPGFAIVGVIGAIVGYVLFSSAQKSVKQIQPVPQKTVDTMKENVEWIKDRTTSDKT